MRLAVGAGAFQSTPPARGATVWSRPPRGVSTYFNPRPPRGGRHTNGTAYDVPMGFQSTPPARGATAGTRDHGPPAVYFNPRPPRGGRRGILAPNAFALVFQSTPPARGGDEDLAALDQGDLLFQSTPPARGATGTGVVYHDILDYFNPRPPRGGRPTIHLAPAGVS